MVASTIERRAAGQAKKAHSFTVVVFEFDGGWQYGKAWEAPDDREITVREILGTGLTERDAERLVEQRNALLEGQGIAGQVAQAVLEPPTSGESRIMVGETWTQ